MKIKIINTYEKLRASYWFVPSIMAVQAVAFAILLVNIDLYNNEHRLLDLSWINRTGAAGARAILSTVASSMITVTGIVFSITIVTLSLTSQQFGPRLLQNFMRDRSNQFVLGTVTSTFLYCLLVLRTVSDGRETLFIPHISILTAVVLAVLCMGVLIYFIHHVTESIQVTSVIAGVSRELARGVERFFPDKIIESEEGLRDEPAPEELLPAGFDDQVQSIVARSSGYLQAVNLTGLIELAEKNDMVIRIKRRVGHFVVAGSSLVEVWPGAAAGLENMEEMVNDHFITGDKRTPEQDIEFLVNELVEVAARALSPGVNDPFTAISCINHLGIFLSDLAQRIFPPMMNKDREDKLRVISYPTSFGHVVDAVFDQIRQYGRENAAVTICLLENIRVIIGFTSHQEQRKPLLHQAFMIEKASREFLPEEADRRDVHERYRIILKTTEECFGLPEGV